MWSPRIRMLSALVFASSVGIAQTGVWTDAQPPASPSFRAGHGLAYEPASELVIAYGGVTDYTSTTVLAETWAYDGCTWSLVVTAGNPGPRFNTYLARSPTAKRLVLFGGSSSVGTLNGATWELDTEPDPPAWINMTPAGPNPIARQNSPPAYDSWRGRTVFFGGADAFAGLFYGDTWEWDGHVWHHVLPPDPLPVPRAWQQMTFDPVRGRTVMFGGFNGNQLGDTWEWDGAHWTLVPTPVSPPARSSTAIAFDSSTQRVVLFGGSYGWPIGLNDTWEYDGATWHQIAIAGPLPPNQYLHRTTGDPLRGGVIVHGSFGDGWTQPNQTWRYHRATLTADTLAPSIGTSVHFTLSIPGDAGLGYVVAVSLSGDCPGTLLPDGRFAPLNVDAATLASLSGALPGVFQAFSGTLGPAGQASPVLAIPVLPGLSGMTITTAALSTNGGVVNTVTNSLKLAVQ
jgi:hypothetical protein